MERGFLSKRGFGFGMMVPVLFETRTLVPSSKNLRQTRVGSLRKNVIQKECNRINLAIDERKCFHHSTRSRGRLGEHWSNARNMV